MASEADIANLALGRLRIGAFISDLDDSSTPARLCSQFFSQCRQEVLQAFPWGFAKRAEALALVSSQTFPGWTYVYQYPSSCLKVLHVTDENGIRFVKSFYSDREYSQLQLLMPWDQALKDDNASRVLLSDVPDAWAIYTVDLDNVGTFPPDFVSAFADRLAMEVGGPLQADDARIVAAGQRYMISVTNAAASHMNETRDDPMPESPSIACRQ